MFIAPGCEIHDTLLLGLDIYQNDAARAADKAAGRAVLGIGELSRLG